MPSESSSQNATSCFLAVKHASLAMAKTNASRGKEHGGGSIVLTASSKLSQLAWRISLTSL